MRPLKVLVCVWIALITLLPAYFIYIGNYAIIRIDDKDENRVVDQVERRDTDIQRSIQVQENAAVLHDSIMQILEKSKDTRSDFEHVVTLSMLLPPIANITRMPTPTSEIFLSYIAPIGFPVVFTDMLVGTTLDNWSWDFLKERWGNHVFQNTRQGNYSTKVNRLGKHFVNRVNVRLGDFVDVVTGARKANENERGLYITKQRVLPPDALEHEFYYPPFYSGKHTNCYLEPTGWIGAAGTFTQGHIDSKDNFVYQLIGKKRWTIYPPNDYQYLYYKKGKGSLEWSAVLSQPGRPDLEKYPLYRNTHPIQFEMQPGEVLYLPRGWTHFVENITPALMLNTWRRGPAAITEQWIERNRREIQKLCKI